MSSVQSGSNVGKWASHFTDPWIARRQASGRKYAGALSYQLAARFFEDVDAVEDWGGGLGAFRAFLPANINYRMVDGTASPYADHVEDLELYRSQANGILLRHVLDHNSGWENILRNALSSFQQKLCVILFCPWSDGDTKELDKIFHVGGHLIPLISFRRQDIEDCIESFPGVRYRLEENIHNPKSEFRVEHIFYIEKG